MIYLADKIYIPKPWAAPSAGVLVLANTINRTRVEIAVQAEELDDYFLCDVNVDIPDGEYDYQLLTGDGEIVSEGVAVKGDYEPSVIESEQTIEYGQY